MGATHKINADLDVSGEVQGTSLDINGAANIDGLLDVNTAGANTVAIFESTDDKAFIRIKDNDTDTHLITKDNVFSIGESSTDYDNFKVDISSGNTTVAGDITCGDDLFMPSGGVINFNSGDVTLTHSSNTLTVGGGNVVIEQGTLTLAAADHVIEDGANILDENDNNLLAFSSGNVSTGGNLTVSGKVTTTEIEGSSILLDSAADIELNCDGADVILKDATTEFGRFKNDSSDFVIKSAVNNKDMIFKGVDNSSTITALTLDMSEAGKATFNNDVVAFSDRKLKDNIETLDGKKVLEMRGVSFTRRDTGLPSSGVIAQEIQEVAPELVNETDGTLGVSYGNLVGYLIEAIKDQQRQIDELKEMCSGCSK
jgi:hypothetical protein